MITTCTGADQYGAIIYYSHLVPVFITLVLAFFALVKSKYSFLSKIFSLFALAFCLWLLGDVAVWTATDKYYDLITFVWAPLDYINIIFYLFGVYFFVVLVSGKDISLWQKILLFGFSFPAWWITATNQSITAFNQPVCEAFNNDFLTQYKLGIEILVVAFIMFYAFIEGRKSDRAKRLQIITVSSALVLFFGVFSVTEYIGSQTGIYEINLYSLFVLPVFLFMIIYSITNLEIFKIKLIGFQLLPYVLVIMVGSQFFFLQNTTDRTLTFLTFVLSLGFAALLLRSGKREIEARNKIEKLAGELENANIQLRDLDRQKDELISIVSHQLNAPVTAIKWYLELLTDGDLGVLAKEQKESLQSMQSITVNLSDLVSMILDVSRIQLGKMHANPQDLDLNQFFKEILDVIEPKAKEKKVHFTKSVAAKLPVVKLDKRLTRMTVENLLTNAVKYTPENGKVAFRVEKHGDMLHCEVTDTGCGIPKAEQAHAFDKLFRASNVRNKIEGNGFGLYVAKGAIESQGGKIWFESEEGKGTTFYIELPLVQKKSNQQ